MSGFYPACVRSAEVFRGALKYSLDVTACAVQTVSEASSQDELRGAAITSIATKIGCTPEPLRCFVHQQERDPAQRLGPTNVEEERVKAIEREMRELRRYKMHVKAASLGANLRPVEICCSLVRFRLWSTSTSCTIEVVAMRHSCSFEVVPVSRNRKALVCTVA